ncbi:GPI-anchored cell wall organization protein Ecm33 [Tothia fuscella]|uniref:GPI-anchored cell wall organization protein Ecm33 n=1 Tax=Tothia fuscella TaxID=1048955 RepID=A0A9P4NT36_9PEZI|nr:GPI-anchored cell wall organization protein Ecm33 [Tothia fuscella]
MLRYALPVLAAIGAAQAQCSAAATLTVQNAPDASALASCTTFSGSIAIATGTSDLINIPNVRQITGDLVIQNAPNATSIGADSLEKVGGDFTVNNCQVLSSLSFPQLVDVGDLSLQALPNLNMLGFTTNIGSAKSLNIQNTRLSTLDGINLQKVNSIYVANNRLLQEISFQVSAIPQNMILESNGDRLSASFPNLQTASNLTFRTCPTVLIPSLRNVTGSLGFYENTFTSIFAPNLTGIGGTLAINTNNQLTNVSLPVLRIVNGGFQVQNNSKLTGASFPKLETIAGALDFYGSFDSVTLPALKDNRGAFNLQSTGDVTKDCATFKAIQGPNNVIKGKYVCQGKVTNPGNIGSTPTSGQDPTKKSDANAFNPNTAYYSGFAGVLAAMFGLL